MTRAATITHREFGRLPNGQAVDEYTLTNADGLSLSAINLGGIVTAVRVPDRAGRFGNVVLGFTGLADYVERNPHFGTIVGRYANRIARGQLVLDGKAYQLGLNDGPNTLHGGSGGFGTRWWKAAAEPPDADGSVALRLDYRSEDGEEGFPGRMDVTVRYKLTAANEWRVDYRATCESPTVINLSHHDYFNLAGSGSALRQRLTLAASRYTPVDAGLIPAEVAPVDGTPFDFRKARVIEDRVREGDPQLALARGYDHNWILDRDGDGLCFAARLQDDSSGRVLDMSTTEPAIQFYSGNFLDGTLRGSGGAMVRQGDGVCLEPQHFPDSPNRPEFPSTQLRPGEVFASATVYRFSVA
ncbi:MAG: aldose epimerase family protein [Ramlibacter sp.]